MNLVVTKNNIVVALVLSVFAHLFFMTIVKIVTPEDLFKTEPFTRVTFLGPILEKTAFDIMVGIEDGAVQGGGMLIPSNFVRADLNVGLPELDPELGSFPFHAGKEMYGKISSSIAGEKDQPDMFFGLRYGQRVSPVPIVDKVNRSPSEFGDRSIIYQPPPPSVISDDLEDGDRFEVKVAAFINGSGDVEDPRIIVTSGYLFVDREALNYLKAWKFQPVEEEKGREYVETEITVYSVTGGPGYDKT